MVSEKSVDLNVYLQAILSDEDKPLFADAASSAKAGALRAAYVMIWISCAESLKRRFREAQRRDGAASKIVGDISTKEQEHKAVDKFVLEKAKEYGFISDSAHLILTHIYEMRCIYGHPYEEAPSTEQVSHAASMVVECVLSKPVRLKHGFCTQLLDNLNNDRSYLDDQKTAVESFARDIVPRIDDSIYTWFLNKYWKSLNQIADDSSLSIFFRRGIWFSRAMIKAIPIDLFSIDEWHQKIGEFPKILTRVCGTPSIFSKIGDRAQDTLIGIVIEESNVRPSILRHLETLSNNSALNDRQQERFDELVQSMNLSSLRSSGLSTKACFTKVISALKSHNWYSQNPAIDLVVSNGANGILALSNDEKEMLGRNILQSADGSSSSAIALVESLSTSIGDWPIEVLFGIFYESFFSEELKIRIKKEHIDSVLKIIDQLDDEVIQKICVQTVRSLEAGTPKYSWSLSSDEINPFVKSAQQYSWAVGLVKCLQDLSSANTQAGEV